MDRVRVIWIGSSLGNVDISQSDLELVSMDNLELGKHEYNYFPYPHFPKIILYRAFHKNPISQEGGGFRSPPPLAKILIALNFAE